MKRTDIHRPSAIVTDDYAFVALGYQRCEGIEDAYSIAENRRIFQAHQEATGATWSHHQHGGNCHVCGARCLYTAIFHHVPTNTYIRTGMDCAAKLEMCDTSGFRAFRESVKSALECKAGKAKAERILTDSGLSRAWELFLVDPADVETHGYDWHFSTIRDIVRQLVRRGYLSSAQEEFLRKLVAEFDSREQIIAEEKAAVAKMTHVGTVGKRQEFDVTFDWSTTFETAYGTSLLCVFSDADGNELVWKTSISSFPGDLERGNSYRIKATVKEHGEYRDKPQTRINRVALLETVAS